MSYTAKLFCQRILVILKFDSLDISSNVVQWRHTRMENEQFD